MSKSQSKYRIIKYMPDTSDRYCGICCKEGRGEVRVYCQRGNNDSFNWRQISQSNDYHATIRYLQDKINDMRRRIFEIEYKLDAWDLSNQCNRSPRKKFQLNFEDRFPINGERILKTESDRDHLMLENKTVYTRDRSCYNEFYPLYPLEYQHTLDKNIQRISDLDTTLLPRYYDTLSKGRTVVTVSSVISDKPPQNATDIYQIKDLNQTNYMPTKSVYDLVGCNIPLNSPEISRDHEVAPIHAKYINGYSSKKLVTPTNLLEKDYNSSNCVYHSQKRNEASANIDKDRWKCSDRELQEKSIFKKDISLTKNICPPNVTCERQDSTSGRLVMISKEPQESNNISIRQIDNAKRFNKSTESSSQRVESKSIKLVTAREDFASLNDMTLRIDSNRGNNLESSKIIDNNSHGVPRDKELSHACLRSTEEYPRVNVISNPIDSRESNTLSYMDCTTKRSIFIVDENISPKFVLSCKERRNRNEIFPTISRNNVDSKVSATQHDTLLIEPKKSSISPKSIIASNLKPETSNDISSVLSNKHQISTKSTSLSSQLRHSYHSAKEYLLLSSADQVRNPEMKTADDSLKFTKSLSSSRNNIALNVSPTKHDTLFIEPKHSSISSKSLIESNHKPETSIDISLFLSNKHPILTKSKSPSSQVSHSSYSTKDHLSLSSADHVTKPQMKTDEDLQNRTIEPMSLRNQQGYCFLNSILQILRGCVEFNENILKYQISPKSNHSNNNTKEDQFFTNICKLYFYLMEGDQKNVEIHLKNVQQYFFESRKGDDVNKCFMLILTKIQSITKQPSSEENIDSYLKIEERTFLNYRMKNNGFIFDLFYGQMSHSIVCKRCKYVINKTFQMFKSLPLPVIKSPSSVKLSSCIDLFFEPSDVVAEEASKCNCTSGSLDLYSQCEITHAPRYLFIYLTRGSYFVNDLKNNTLVETDEILGIKTLRGIVFYKLISVIDHLGDNAGGHYYCKCNYEGSKWTLISDEQISDLGFSFDGIVSKSTIAFMFKCT